MSTQAKRHTALLVALALLLAPQALLAQDAADEPPDEPAAEAEPDEAAEPDEGEPTAEEPAEEEETTAEEPEPAAEPTAEPTAEEAAAAEESAAGEEADGDEEPEIEPFVPGMGVPEEDAVPYDDQLEDEDQHVDDGKPFAKGDIELGLGLGGFGSSEYFVLSVGGSFAYYVVNRLAPGIDINYMHVFSDDFDYPDSFTLLPFLKFVILRSTRFAPYLILAGGREFQWGGSSDPTKGVREADAWILGGGAGAHIGLGEHFALKLQLLALYYWYDETKVFGVKDSWFNDDNPETGQANGAAFFDANRNPCDPDTSIAGPDPNCYEYYDKSGDTKDIDGELFFPLISIGFAVFF